VKAPRASPLESVNIFCTGTQGGRSGVAGFSRETLPALHRAGDGDNGKRKEEGKGEQAKAPPASPLESLNLCCTGTQGGRSGVADFSRETLPALNRASAGDNGKRKEEGKGEQAKVPSSLPARWNL